MKAAFLKASAIFVVAAAVASCGGSNGSGSSTPTTPSPTSFTISILGDRGSQSFNPNPAPAGGQPVVFRNADGVLHRIVSNDGTLDFGDVAPGATSRVMSMPTGGTNYHCTLHPGMIGGVSATSGGGPPPCNDPGYC